MKKLHQKTFSEMTLDEREDAQRIQGIKCLYCWAAALELTPESQDWWVKTTVDKDHSTTEELDDTCTEHHPELAAALLRIEDVA